MKRILVLGSCGPLAAALMITGSLTSSSAASATTQICQHPGDPATTTQSPAPVTPSPSTTNSATSSPAPSPAPSPSDTASSTPSPAPSPSDTASSTPSPAPSPSQSESKITLYVQPSYSYEDDAPYDVSVDLRGAQPSADVEWWACNALTKSFHIVSHSTAGAAHVYGATSPGAANATFTFNVNTYLFARSPGSIDSDVYYTKIKTEFDKVVFCKNSKGTAYDYCGKIYPARVGKGWPSGSNLKMIISRRSGKGHPYKAVARITVPPNGNWRWIGCGRKTGCDLKNDGPNLQVATVADQYNDIGSYTD